jgi:hypothetical protein
MDGSKHEEVVGLHDVSTGQVYDRVELLQGGPTSFEIEHYREYPKGEDPKYLAPTTDFVPMS